MFVAVPRQNRTEIPIFEGVVDARIVFDLQ